MKLLETFDKPAKLTVTKNASNAVHAYAKIGDRIIEYRLEKIYNRLKIHGAPDRWILTFSEVRDEKPRYTFKLTGSGNALEVFATAKEFINLAIKARHPDTIKFEAYKDNDEPSRSTLYKRFVKRWTPVGYKLEEPHSNEDRDLYTWSKI